MERLITTNVYSVKGDVVISGACLQQVDPASFNKLTKGADQVYSVCLEESHINMIVTKISAILATGQVTSMKFISVDRSPHCTQLHYIKHEVERTLKEHCPISDYVVLNGEITEVSDEAVDMSKSLGKLGKIY